MFNKFLFTLPKNLSRTRLIRLVLVIALSATACGGSPANPGTATPTTVMGVLPIVQPTDLPTQIPTKIPTEIPTEIPTQIPTPGQVSDVCSLITKAEAEAVLGQTVASIRPGVDTDSLQGQTVNFCTFLGNGLAVVISMVDAGSAVTAEKLLNQQLDRMLADDPSTTITQETGFGDQVFWSTAEDAAGYTVLQDSHVFILILGGNIGDAAAHKDALVNLAKSVAGKL